MIPQLDGSYVVKPRKPNDADFDTWVTVKEAAKILIGFRMRRLYQLREQLFFVYRRPTVRRYVLSLKSVLAFKQATQDPDFWDNPELQQRLIRQVQSVMAQMKQADGLPPKKPRKDKTSGGPAQP